MNAKYLFPALGLGFFLTASLAASQSVPSVREVVEHFDAAQAKANTIQAPFTLTTRRALLKAPTVTKGTLYIQGSEFVHFTFAPPEDLVLHLTPKELISFSPGAGKGERLKIGRIKNANRQFLGLGQNLSYLSDYFSIAVTDSKDAGGSYQLVLMPRSLSMKKRVQSIMIWVDRDTFLPKQVQWIERGGDSWFLELGPMALNQPIPAAVTGFKVPEGIVLRSEFSFFATQKR